MERITENLQALLKPASTELAASSRGSLSKKGSSTLLALLDSLSRRYPSQDLEASMAEYQRDYKALALKYSLREVEEGVNALRINSEQRFFPHPDEVAEQIKFRREARRTPSVEETKRMLAAEEAERQRILNDPAEIALRVAHFGYDPYRERREG